MADKNRVQNAATKGSKKLKKMARELQQCQPENIAFIARQQPIKIKFDSRCTLSDSYTLLNFEDEILTVNQNILVKNININIKGPQKIVITGQNGIGKSLLLKKILMHLQKNPLARVGYIPQNSIDVLDDSNMTALTYLNKINSNTDINYATLIDYGFEREEVIYSVRNLSGGQQIKLMIAMALLSHCNVLIVDEPTNNLSPLSAPPLRQALIDFPGTVIAVSHDRKLIKLFENNIWELTSQGLNKIEP